MRNRTTHATVIVGDRTVTLKREGRTRLVVAGILERIDDAEGTPRQITLDRVIHRLGEDCFEGWKVEGAVCSVLSPMPCPLWTRYTIFPKRVED